MESSSGKTEELFLAVKSQRNISCGAFRGRETLSDVDDRQDAGKYREELPGASL